MPRKPQRTIEAAIISDIGPVTANDLLHMADNSWGLIRDRITDFREGKDGLLARCMACTNPVFIKTRRSQGKNKPFFSHYNGSDRACPWHHDRNLNPDAIRAEQYQGQQESNFHRLMCEEIAKIASLDERYITHRVEDYLPPTQNSHGRFPDVYVEWEQFGPFVVEFQMSSTFQTEISARCKHYEYEGIPLLWVLFGIEQYNLIPQNIADVIRRHRGNAFVLDHRAIEESKRQRTLVLSCHLRDGDNFAPSKLVRFDELHIPRTKIPYYEDRIAKPFLAEIERLRRPWFTALSEWDRYKPLRGLERPQSLLVAAAFSIVADANGKFRNYASKHTNISGMLNTYLHAGILAPYADLLTQLLQNTARHSLLDSTVGEHLQRYKTKVQADETSNEWLLLKQLLPEALDPIQREELQYLEALPEWASKVRP